MCSVHFPLILAELAAAMHAKCRRHPTMTIPTDGHAMAHWGKHKLTHLSLYFEAQPKHSNVLKEEAAT